MADMKKHKLGWIGIGRMGYAMAQRLAQAGCDIAVWNRSRIGAGTPVAGPAAIEEPYTTVLLAEGWTCRRDASGHLIAERT